MSSIDRLGTSLNVPTSYHTRLSLVVYILGVCVLSAWKDDQTALGG